MEINTPTSEERQYAMFIHLSQLAGIIIGMDIASRSLVNAQRHFRLYRCQWESRNELDYFQSDILHRSGNPYSASDRDSFTICHRNL